MPDADLFKFGGSAVIGRFPRVLVPPVADDPLALAQAAAFRFHARQAFRQRASFAVHGCQLIRQKCQVQVGIHQTGPDSLPLQVDLPA